MKRFLGSCQQNRHLRQRETEKEKERGDHLQALRIWKQEAPTASSVDPLTSPPVLSGNKPLGAKARLCSTQAHGPGSSGESQRAAPTGAPTGEPRPAERGSAPPSPPDPAPRHAGSTQQSTQCLQGRFVTMQLLRPGFLHAEDGAWLLAQILKKHSLCHTHHHVTRLHSSWRLTQSSNWTDSQITCFSHKKMRKRWANKKVDQAWRSEP